MKFKSQACLVYTADISRIRRLPENYQWTDFNSGHTFDSENAFNFERKSFKILLGIRRLEKMSGKQKTVLGLQDENR